MFARAPTTTSLLGIQIQDCGITLLALDGTQARPRLTHFAHVPLSDPNLDSVPHQPSTPALRDALRSALQQSGARVRRCALSIPDRDISRKEIDPPATEGALLTGDALEAELEIIAEGLPGLGDAQEVVWDVATLPTQDTATSRLQLRAMPGEYYYNLHSLCAESGLQLERLEPASLALQRALPVQAEDRPYLAVLDLGREHAQLYSFANRIQAQIDQLRLSQRQQLPADWHLPLCDPSLRAEDHSALHAAAETLQSEAERLLQSAQTQNTQLRLQRLWLIGSATQAPPLVRALQQLPIAAQPYNPLIEIERVANISESVVQRYGSSAVFAFGLALQSLPTGDEDQRAKRA
jgi:Tfp pilus assembly PilM family ATPase